MTAERDFSGRDGVLEDGASSSEPADADDGFPPGIRLRHTHGVRVLEIDDHPKDKPKCEKRLSHPSSGADVRVIGSAHVSSTSAKEVKRVILENKPDIVVIELDGERLKSLLSAATEDRPAAHAAERVSTVRKAFESMMKGDLAIIVGSLGYATIGAILDTRPGAEFLAAVEAAQQVGALIVLGDRNQKVTVGRLMKRVRRGSKMFDELSRNLTEEVARDEHVDYSAEPQPASKETVVASRKRAVAHFKGILDKSGCEASDEVIKTSLEMLDSALRGVPLRVDDLMRVRKCAKKVVEFVRVESFKGNETFSPGSRNVSLGKKLTLTDWASAETVIRERDLVLATALQRDPTAASIVGVVGAGHIAGIEREWANVDSPESRARFNEYLQDQPSDIKPVDYTNRILTGALGAAAFTTILRRGSPRAVAAAGAVVGSVLTLAAVGTYAGASGLVALGKIAVAIEDASIRAADLGGRKDSARARGSFTKMIVRDAVIPWKESA